MSFAVDMDALHVLPLSIVPLRSEGLKRARLVKNAELKGVVELFSGQGTGSGQIAPDELGKVFQFDGDNRKDLEIVQSLSLLSSYDIYSLRRELRRLGIAVDREASLRLSEQKQHELTVYMRMFTRPLIATVYGSQRTEAEDLQSLLELFACPDFRQARENLRRVCGQLGITLSDIPKFLEDYGDVYLSLAYYRYCLDQDMPRIRSCLEALPEIRRSVQPQQDPGLVRACRFVERKLRDLVTQITDVIEGFRVSTEDMWQDLSTASFRGMETLINDTQARIGGGLCALHVKMELWAREFPKLQSGGLARRSEFIMTRLRQGLDKIPEIALPRPTPEEDRSVFWV